MGSGRQTIEPWDRQEKETAKAYAAFQVYRDMGPERTTRKTAERVEKYYTLIQRWSAANGWVARAAAWDKSLDRQAQQEQIKAVRDMNKRHVQTAIALQSRAAERLKALNSGELSPEALLRYITEAVKLERLARGEPDSITEERRRQDELEGYTEIRDFITNPEFIRALQQTAAGFTGEGNAGGLPRLVDSEDHGGAAMDETDRNPPRLDDE